MGSKKRKKAEQRRLKAEQALVKTKTIQAPKIEKSQLFILAAILLITFLVFSPNLNNGFVNWDDDRNFLENEHITTLNNTNFWINTKKIFTSDVIGGYNPLTIWTFLLEKKFFGFDQPIYWHLDNILLHMVCVFFVFWIGIRLRLGIIGASILALLFGIHPLRVESVAWVTERKDVLFGAFYLAAIFFYIKGKQESFRKRDIFIIALCFGLSLFSKIQAVILPISLILVDYYMSKTSQITVKSILNKAPFFLGSLAFGIMGVIFLQGEGSTEQVYTGITRIFIGAYQLLIYYVKAIFPFRMSPLYPYPSSIGWYFYPAILSFITTAFILWRTYFKSKNKVIFFGVAFFFANVALLLQVFGAGQGFLADRFTYIPYFGLFFIMAYYINALIKNKPNLKNIVLGLTGVVLLAYAFLNFNQNKIWKDSATLWTHVLKHYDHTTLPWGNRANYYRDNGQTQKALYDYGQVIRLKPNAPEPYNSRARLYFNFSQRDSLLKALSNYNKAIELKEDVEYVVNRGATYAKLGNFEKSLENLNHAERIDPTFANIYLNRSVIYNRSGNYAKALEDVTKYLNLKPFYADMWYEKGRLHYIVQQYQEAVNSCSRAIQNNVKNGLYYFERAKAYQSLGNSPQAKSDLQTSQRLGYKGDANTTNTITNSN